MINNQLGGTEPADSEDPNPTVPEAASTENISSITSIIPDIMRMENPGLIGMQETGTPVN
jgi:hypothetical protein